MYKVICMILAFQFIIGIIGGLLLTLCVSEYFSLKHAYNLTLTIFEDKNIFGIITSSIFYIFVFLPCCLFGLFQSLVLYSIKRIYELGCKK